MIAAFRSEPGQMLRIGLSRGARRAAGHPLPLEHERVRSTASEGSAVHARMAMPNFRIGEEVRRR